MRRQSRAARFRPLLRASEIAMAAAIDDVSGTEDCRHLLIRIPDDWEFSRIEHHPLAGGIDTVPIGRGHPDGLPAGRYLRIPVEPLMDPWGRVAVGLEFDTPSGPQCAELTIQTRDDRASEASAANTGAGAPTADRIRLQGRALRNLTGKTTVFFVEGNPGDLLDLSDEESGAWSAADSDGAHRLYIRHDRAGRRSAAIAVRHGIEVKLD